MMRAGPRPVWPERGKVVHGFSCRFMHDMNAQLFTKRLARKKGFKIKRTVTKKPLVGQRPWGINEPGGMLNRNGPASDVLLLVPAVHLVLFLAGAVR